MATEIVTLKVKDSFTPQQCERSIDYFRPPPPGLQSLAWGRTTEDPNTVIWILNWDSVKAHEDFMQASVYPAFVATIIAFCTAPISLFHTYLQPSPSPNLFQADIIDIAIATRKPEVSPEMLETANGRLLGLVQKVPGHHSHFQGIKFEDNNVHVSLVAWESIEAMESHTANEAVNESRAAIADLIVPETSYMYHVKLIRSQ